MKLVLERITDNGTQTIGRLYVLNEKGITVWDCPTLELPWKNNNPNVSCIPTGWYNVIKRTSAKFGTHFHILEVDGRSYILIHRGNYYTQIRGCILVGMDMSDINRDGHIDVVQSVPAMEKLLKLMPNKFELTIVNGYEIKQQQESRNS